MSIDVKQPECDNCSQSVLFSTLEITDVLNHGYLSLCDDCLDGYVSCDGCGIYAKYESDLIYLEVYCKYLCDDCLSGYTKCYNCDEYIYDEDVSEVEHNYYCKCCFDDVIEQCNWCNENMLIESGINFYNETICESCNDNYVVCCVNCRDRVHIDDGYGDGYCERCFDEEEDVQCGSTRCSTSLNYYRLDDEPTPRMYYGIELETGTFDYINFENDIINELPTEYFDRHEDCSIFDNGVKQGIEIVGHPMTYKWMKANPDIWNNVLKLRKKGLRSYKTKTCGIHIHLSKKAFDEHHLYKFMKMIYGFPSFTRLISQRNDNNLRRWATINGDCTKNLKQKAKDKCNNGMRNIAVNLDGSYNTVEIRLFRGTLNEMAFWKNIEYIQALLEFTANAKVKELSIKNYLSYIYVKKHEFCNLYNWLKKKGKLE